MSALIFFRIGVGLLICSDSRCHKPRFARPLRGAVGGFVVATKHLGYGKTFQNPIRGHADGIFRWLKTANEDL